MKTHWINPWQDAIPVPIEELVECDSSLNQWCSDTQGNSFVLTRERILEHWNQAGDKIDAYILPSNLGHCMGIRYGNEGSHYLSPLGNQAKLEALLAKYQGK